MSFISAAEADKNTYDVIVVGSGAAGGQTAYTLTMDGARVLMLEAGRNYEPGHRNPDAPDQRRGASARQRHARKALRLLGRDHRRRLGGSGRALHQRLGRPGAEVRLVARAHVRRAHQSLGPHLPAQRSLRLQAAHARRPRLRLADELRRSRAVLRQGRDAHRRVRRRTTASRTRRIPRRACCCRRPSRASATCWSSKRAAQAAAFRSSPVIARCSPRRLDHKRLPKLLHPGNAKAQAILAADMQKRAACFWATPCGRGCSIRANYQSTTVHLPPALDTGNLDIVTDAMVRAVTKRKDGSAEGVIYIDRKTGAEHRVKARIVVLAASALESVRILLNSGVANGSGKVGKYIMDTVGANFGGQVPAAREPAAAQRRRRRRRAPVHRRGGCTRSSSRASWASRAATTSNSAAAAPCPAWAPARGPRVAQRRHLRQEVQGRRAALLRLVRGLRRTRRDDSERRLLRRARSQGEGQVRHSRCCVSTGSGREHETRPGRAHAEDRRRNHRRHGRPHTRARRRAARRPSSRAASSFTKSAAPSWATIPTKSVTNSFGQSWEMKNLFITDGATLCSNADKNPTLTIMALAWRSAEHMLGLMKRKEL